MKNLLIILFSLFVFSWESLGLGVEENQSSLTYFEYVAFGWQAFFDNNYSQAIDYFNVALESEDEIYHNSAHVGLGWVYLVQANQSIGTTLSEQLRNQAMIEFQTQDDQLAMESYEQNCVLYSFCCEDCFIDDKEVAIIYNDALEYLQSDNPDNLNLELETKILDFISSHQEIDGNFYDFMNGKPSVVSDFSLTTNSVVVLLAQIYLRNSNFSCAMDILYDNGLCEYQNSDGVNQTLLFDCGESCNEGCETAINPEDVLNIIECLETYSSF